MLRGFYVALGFGFVVIALVGVVVPLLPTTPFLILAAGCFARGSEHFADWLAKHPVLGPPLRAWKERQVVPLVGKIAAGGFLGGSVVWALGCPVSNVPLLGQVALVLVALGVMVFLLTKPSRPPMRHP